MLALDKENGLAAQLARDGDPEPIHIEETDANFSIEWKGRYRIEGAAFVYVDPKTGGTRTILGYPTQRKYRHAGEVAEISNIGLLGQRIKTRL